MKFRAGDNGYAVAAGCVEGVGPARQGVRHLAQLLAGVTDGDDAGIRTLQLVSRGRRFEITVDGPVEVVELSSGDITPCRTPLDGRILGFARLKGDMYALLDADRLAELARASGDDVKSHR
jgi:hypothetical protein